MKKAYITPSVSAYSVASTNMVCVSARFGEGTTDTMHAKSRDAYEENEEVEF